MDQPAESTEGGYRPAPGIAQVGAISGTIVYRFIFSLTTSMMLDGVMLPVSYRGCPGRQSRRHSADLAHHIALKSRAAAQSGKKSRRSRSSFKRKVSLAPTPTSGLATNG